MSRERSEVRAQGRWPTALECLLWAVLAMAAVLIRTAPDLNPFVANDSAVYLSVADNVLAGNGAATSIIHFDPERGLGVLPAPVVTFPPGYAYAIAGVAMTGIDTGRAALVVSLVSIGGAVLLLLQLCRLFELPVLLSRVVIAVFAINTGTTAYGSSASTEALFTVCALAFCVLYLSSLRLPQRLRDAFLFAVLAGIALGISYWIRYAGLFFELGIVALCGWFVLRRQWYPALLSGVACASGGLLIAAGMLRNIALVGNWRGGNSKAVFNDPMELALRSIKTVDHLALGDNTNRLTLGLRVVLAVVLLAIVVRLWLRRAATTQAEPMRRGAAPSLLFELTAVVGAYSALMLYAGLTTVISFGARMFYPVLPLLLVVLAVLAAWLTPRRVRTALAGGVTSAMFVLAFAVYAAVSLVDAYTVPLNVNTARIAARLDARLPNGDTVRDEITRLAGASGAIVANDGQMMGHVLKLPTLSLVERHFTATVWDEQQVQELFTRYQVKALILSIPAPLESREALLPSEFIEKLARGEHPAWLREVVSTPAIRVYGPG